MSELSGLPTRYEVLAELGRGAFGRVYKAKDHLLRRTIALKVLTRDASATDDMLLREAQALAAVTSPHVVGVLDVLSLPEARVLALEFMPGGSLADFIGAKRFVSPERALSWLADAARGLAAIHEAGLLHCDLKPANVLLDASDGARIADFGLARYVHHDSDAAAGGSLGYAAPEVVAGEPPTTASDVYGLGVIAWELFSGRRAYEGQQTLEVLGAQLTTALPSLTGIAASVPANARALIEQCVNADPACRPTADALADAIESVLARGRSGQRLRSLRGLGITLVVPATIVVTGACVLLAAWALPVVSDVVPVVALDEVPRPRYHELKLVFLVLGKGLGAMTKFLGLLVAVIGSAVAGISQLRSGDGHRRPLRQSLREMFEAPAWWPTWYPGNEAEPSFALLPPSIKRFRFATWWLLPIVLLPALLAMAISLAPSQPVSLETARLCLALCLVLLLSWLVWLARLIVYYRDSAVYDALELVEVALIRRPVADTRRAFPEPTKRPPVAVPPEPEPSLERPWPWRRRWWRDGRLNAGALLLFLVFFILRFLPEDRRTERDPDHFIVRDYVNGGKDRTVVYYSRTPPPAAISGLTIASGSTSVPAGKTTQVKAAVVPAGGAVLVTTAFTSNATGVATVSPGGLVTAVAPGTCVITVKVTGQGGGFTTNTVSEQIVITVTR